MTLINQAKAAINIMTKLTLSNENWDNTSSSCLQHLSRITNHISEPQEWYRMNNTIWKNQVKNQEGYLPVGSIQQNVVP